MRLAQVKAFLEGQMVFPETAPDIDIQYAYASDLMSDILVAVQRGALLLTGLTNNQVIRTGKIAAGGAIVFVRGKKPSTETIKLAEQYNIPIMTTELSMFDACGILFSNGIKGIPPQNRKRVSGKD
jgi:hypothetical protein